MDELLTLVIQGICNYYNSYKQKQWQLYTALTAVAYAKLLLSTIPALPIVNGRISRFFDKGSAKHSSSVI
jgi:hypothetical protein